MPRTVQTPVLRLGEYKDGQVLRNALGTILICAEKIGERWSRLRDDRTYWFEASLEPMPGSYPFWLAAYSHYVSWGTDKEPWANRLFFRSEGLYPLLEKLGLVPYESHLVHVCLLYRED